ncbi:MAG: hypothetical protein KC912_02980 [Proteobacteria bacterium]|nr:hypothetical protein [Pseudomonadota bacterium]
MLALFAGPASAQQLPVQAWQDLHRARLAEAIDHDVDRAERIYRRLIQSLAAEDPIREEALYSLGSALYSTGRNAEAVEVLLEGNRTAQRRSRFQDLLQLIELDQTSVRRIPARWDFGRDAHGLLHPWGYQEKGSLRISAQPDGNSVLVWSTRVAVSEDDQLLIGFDNPQPAPAGIRFDVAATVFDAWLEVVVHDDLGRAWTWPEGRLRARTNLLLTFDLAFSGFVLADGSRDSLDTSTIDRLVIRDVSAFQGKYAGDHDILLDDVEIY